MKRKYIDERFGEYMSHWSIPKTPGNATLDLTNSAEFQLESAPSTVGDIAARDERLLDMIHRMATAFSEADHAAFVAFWYG